MTEKEAKALIAGLTFEEKVRLDVLLDLVFDKHKKGV